MERIRYQHGRKTKIQNKTQWCVQSKEGVCSFCLEELNAIVLDVLYVNLVVLMIIQKAEGILLFNDGKLGPCDLQPKTPHLEVCSNLFLLL